MKITNEILRDLIYCPYKAYNDVSREDAPAEPEISALFKALKESHFKRYAERNRASSSISFVPKFENEHFSLTFDAIDGKSKSNKIAILTVPFESVTKTDKIYIALASHLLYSEFAVKISRCKLVYGEEFKASYLKVPTYKRHILKLIQNLQKIRDNSRAPAFYKNEHCPFCRFFNECNKSLQEKDDLSLLAGLKLKEVASKHSHGIFTVRQLAFTFRARRRSTQARKYRPELKAMAIRDKKTYIQEGWNIPRSEVEVFLDMEGTPDRNLQYLIGMVIRTMDIATTYSFWANGPTEEGQILGDMLSVLSNHKDFIIYHYGAYESKALISLAKRFPEHQESVEWILPKMFNLLSILSQHVYVPTYTNGLKEIAKFLDFKWTDEFATGLQSIVWRYNWEYSKDEAFKQKLLQYNVDDCLALIKVFDWVSGLSMSYPNREVLKEPKPTNVYKWGNTEYAINDFEKVNEKAYFDYQRNHILLRKHKNKFLRRFQDAKRCRVNKATKRISLFPLTCPRCKKQRSETETLQETAY